ncbi:hypothetical protein K456DRAFT_1923842, partial [Colletotrichum gloeosporioides 23]
IPYTCCFQAKVPCRFSEKLSRCHTYIKAKKPCDSVLVASTYIEFTYLQTQIAEAASRLSCIHKMRKLVRERQTEAFEQGIQEIDEEDSVLPALDAHER